MKKLSAREKVIAGITFVLIGVYALIFWIMRPLNDLLVNIDEGIASSQKKLIKGQQLLESSSGMQESLEKLQDAWGIAASDEGESSDLVAKLESAALTANIRILNIEPRPITKDILVHYPIALTVTGPSKGVMKFLYLIQNKPLALSVDNLNLERTIDGDTVLNGTMTVTRLRVIR